MTKRKPYTQNDARYDISIAQNLVSNAEYLERDASDFSVSLSEYSRITLRSQAMLMRSRANRKLSKVRGAVINCVRTTRPEKYLELLDALNLPFVLREGIDNEP